MTTYQAYEAYDVREAAAILKVRPSTLRTWIQRGLVNAVRLPGPKGQGRYRITGEEIQRILTPSTNRNTGGEHDEGTVGEDEG